MQNKLMTRLMIEESLEDLMHVSRNLFFFPLQPKNLHDDYTGSTDADIAAGMYANETRIRDPALLWS
jgi:hypothetical protein